jgi:predicted metal-dependent hydrolase
VCIRDGLTYWASRLRAELDAALPGALLTWTTSMDAAAWYNVTADPKTHYHINLAYDYAALAK